MNLMYFRGCSIILSIGFALLQTGCITRTRSPHLRFHYYELKNEWEKVTPSNVEIYTFNGLQLPLYPTNLLRKEPAVAAFPMLNKNEIRMADLLECSGKERTFICFENYYPVEITDLFEHFQLGEAVRPIGYKEHDGQRDIVNILIPLLPKAPIQASRCLSLEEPYVSVLWQGRRFPFISHQKCWTAYDLMLSKLGIDTLKTPDILPLNYYYSAIEVGASHALNLAYPGL